MNQEALKSARRPLLVVLGVLAMVAAVLAVLLVGSDEEPSRPRLRPELDRLALSERVWVAEGVTLLLNGGTVRLRDGLLLVGTEDGLQLLDVESGAALWAQDDFAELPGQTVALDPAASQQLPFLVRHGGGVGVLVPYRLFKCSLVEPGLALLSGETGGVVWQAPTTPADGCVQNSMDWEQDVWAADDTTALVSVAPNFGHPDDVGQVRTLALDVATGQRKWEHQGAWPQAIAGGVALVSTNRPPSSFTRPGMVTALDLATGQPRWTLNGRYPAAHLVAVAGDVVVVVTADESGTDRTVRVLDSATGRELATLPDVEPASCVTDATTLVACKTGSESREPRLVTFRVADRAVTTVPIEEHTVLQSVVQGRISVELAGRKPSIFTIDRTGNVIDKKPPGVLLAAADDLLLVKATRDEQDEFLAVYRMNG